MDSPTRDLLETLEHADRELEKMEKHQEEYERNLETFDASAENGTDVVAGGSDHLKKLIEHHKGKALSQEQPTHIQPVSASYMGPLSYKVWSQRTERAIHS